MDRIKTISVSPSVNLNEFFSSLFFSNELNDKT